MRTAYVYILECSDETLYTGWTFDLLARFNEHSAGKGAKYTRSRRPLHIRYVESHPGRRSAMRREAEIKKMKRADKLKLIRRSHGQG